jgi:hypothetical protein
MKSDYAMVMKQDHVNFERKQDLSGMNGNGSRRKQKNYFDKFLGMMMRKTGSDERVTIYGNDPFK